MPEKPKREREEKQKKDSWAEDQKKHDYYYDDAHGYEDYSPDKPDDEQAEDEGENKTAA